MSDTPTAQTPQSSISRAQELKAQLKQLQDQVESLDAALVQENVSKVSIDSMLGRCSLIIIGSGRATRLFWGRSILGGVQSAPFGDSGIRYAML